MDERFNELRSNDNKEMFGADGLITDLTARLVKKMLEAEMDEHLGFEHGEHGERRRSNHRKGTSSKTLKSEIGDVKIEVPRDREGRFEPKVVKKHQRKLGKLEEQIVVLRGASQSKVAELEQQRDKDQRKLEQQREKQQSGDGEPSTVQ